MCDNITELNLLTHLINEMNKATARAEKALDETLEFVEKSNRRIEIMEFNAAQLMKVPRG